MPPFPPNGMPAMAPPTSTQSPGTFVPPQFGIPTPSFVPPTPAVGPSGQPADQADAVAPELTTLPPKDGVIWPDNEATPVREDAPLS